MTEEERLENINKNAAEHLQYWLEQLENGEVTENDLVSSLHANMIIAYLYGYSPDAMAVDAKAAAAKLIAMVEKEDPDVEPEVNICKNKDADGNCPLHNLHCQYPDCER